MCVFISFTCDTNVWKTIRFTYKLTLRTKPSSHSLCVCAMHGCGCVLLPWALCAITQPLLLWLLCGWAGRKISQTEPIRAMRIYEYLFPCARIFIYLFVCVWELHCVLSKASTAIHRRTTTRTSSLLLIINRNNKNNDNIERKNKHTHIFNRIQ